MIWESYISERIQVRGKKEAYADYIFTDDYGIFNCLILTIAFHLLISKMYYCGLLITIVTFYLLLNNAWRIGIWISCRCKIFFSKCNQKRKHSAKHKKRTLRNVLDLNFASFTKKTSGQTDPYSDIHWPSKALSPVVSLKTLTPKKKNRPFAIFRLRAKRKEKTNF